MDKQSLSPMIIVDHHFPIKMAIVWGYPPFYRHKVGPWLQVIGSLQNGLITTWGHRVTKDHTNRKISWWLLHLGESDSTYIRHTFRSVEFKKSLYISRCFWIEFGTKHVESPQFCWRNLGFGNSLGTFCSPFQAPSGLKIFSRDAPDAS